MSEDAAPDSPEREAPFSSDEVHRLREMLGTPPTPWWKNYPLIIAGAGFLLSLTTAVISAYVGHRKDVHDRQAQLATTIQTIQELTAKQYQMLTKSAVVTPGALTQQQEDPSIAISVALVNTLHRRGVELALGLGTEASTAELIVLAEGSYALGNYVTTEHLLKLALESAQSANDESIALRRLAYVTIQTSTTLAARRDGEEFYNQAANLDRKYRTLPPYAMNFLKATGELDWADGVASYDCTGAQRHFESGVASMERNPRTPEMEQMRRSVLMRFQGGIGGVATCKPSPTTVVPS